MEVNWVTIWLTAQEAAEHVRMANTRIILQAIKSGDLPAHSPTRTGNIRDVRIKQSDLDAWLEARPWEPL